MKKDESPPSDSRTPHERFLALGTKVLSVPKADLDALEKKWQARKRTKRAAKRR